MKHPTSIIISFDSSFIKIVQAKAGFVEKIAKVQVSANADAALRAALAQFPVKASNIVIALPAETVTTKNIEVPSTSAAEIESILSLQAARHTPFTQSEILTSFIRLESSRQNHTRVLLVVVKRDIVNDKINLLRVAGVPTDTVIFAPEAMALAFAKSFQNKKSSIPAVLIDVGSQSSSCMVIARGKLALSRGIPIGTEHFSVDTDAPAQFIGEVKATAEAYQQEAAGATLVDCYFTGQHAAMGNVIESLGKQLGLTVKVVDCLNFFKSSKAIQSSVANDPAFDALASGAFAGNCEAELVPQQIKDQRAVSQKGQEILRAGILLLLVLFFVGAGLLSKVYFKEQFLRNNLLGQYSQQRQEVQNLEKLIARTRVLRTYVQGRTVPLEVLKELYQIIPEDIYVSNVSIEETGGVTVQGISASMSKVFNFVTALESASIFENVKTRSTAAKKDRGKDVAAFEIGMMVSQAEPEGEDESEKLKEKP